MARISRRAMRDRVVEYLRQAAEQPENIGFWDDYCIAWMTVAKAARGERSPHFWATYEHLGTAPEQIWAMTMAERRNKLGKHFSTWFDQAGNRKPDVPKIPASSEKVQLQKIARVAGLEVWPKKQTAEVLMPRRLESVNAPLDMGLTTQQYPNSERSASAIIAPLCIRCGFPSSRLLCADCLRRGHSSSCPSPNSDCSCGFSEAFWRATGGLA